MRTHHNFQRSVPQSQACKAIVRCAGLTGHGILGASEACAACEQPLKPFGSMPPMAHLRCNSTGVPQFPTSPVSPLCNSFSSIRWGDNDPQSNTRPEAANSSPSLHHSTAAMLDIKGQLNLSSLVSHHEHITSCGGCCWRAWWNN